jgi:hypothetical protein
MEVSKEYMLREDLIVLIALGINPGVLDRSGSGPVSSMSGIIFWIRNIFRPFLI